MINNLEYKLRQVERELKKQQEKYNFAATWGDATKHIAYKIVRLKEERKMLLALIKKLKRQPNAG